MPNNWINRRYLTAETEIINDEGEKIHDLLPLNQGDSVLVDPLIHPVLHRKLGGGTVYLPNMPTPPGSPVPYKIIADAT